MMNQLRRLWDIPFTIRPSFYLMIGVLTLINLVVLGAAGIINTLYLVSIFFFVILHEYGHCWAAHRCGLQVREVSLWALGGQAHIAGIEELTPKEDIKVSFAGPLVNIVICLVCWPIHHFLDPHLLGAQVLSSVVSVNLILAIFNLIPAFPLDGGRILRALLTLRYGAWKATQLSVKIGKGFAIAFGLVAVFTGNFFLVLIAFFIWEFCQKMADRPDMML